MIVSWASALPSGLASFVEFVEALTIVLAVAAVCGWKSAMTGAAAGVVVLCCLVLALGPLILRIPTAWFQIGVGTLLVLFGTRWLRKAILRSAGVLAMHDEAAAYSKKVAALSSTRSSQAAAVSREGVITAMNGVFVEGLEVIFIVLAIAHGSQSKLMGAVFGAIVAFVLVALLGFALRSPLTRVPENALKMMVGIILSSLGTLWVGEGIGVTWPLGDRAVVLLAVFYVIVAWAGVQMAARLRAARPA